MRVPLARRMPPGGSGVSVNCRFLRYSSRDIKFFEFAPRPGERNRAALKIQPRVGNFFQPFEDVSDGYAVGPEVIAPEIIPIEWNRHGGTGAGTHRVRTN